jgi:hypothetical protein
MPRVDNRILKLMNDWTEEDERCCDVNMQHSLSFALGAARAVTTALPNVETSIKALEDTLRRQLKKETDKWGRDKMRECINDVLLLREALAEERPHRTKRAPARAPKRTETPRRARTISSRAKTPQRVPGQARTSYR